MTLYPALFAAIVVVLTSATDRELVIRWPDGTVVTAPAKAPPPGGRDPCEDAKLRLWQPLGAPPIAEATRIECVPGPGAFAPRSECIEGYHGPRKEGYCR